MDTTIPIPKPIRRLLIVASAFLLVSIALTVGNAVTILAAPPQSPFVPSTVGFEGQLADATGSPVANGNYSITFSLYSVATSGTALWSETQSVAVSDGLYSVQLGSVTAIAASDFDGNRWLGVQVSGDSEMTPRIAIGAVPFALNARQAMGLQGRDVAATAPNDSDVLTWDNTASQWGPAVPGARTFPEINALNSDETPQNFFENYRNGALLSYVSASAIDVSSGEIMINGKMRRNTTAVQINFAGTGDLRNRGLDTGTEQPNTTYYVYAAADDVESVFDVIISASSSAPTGPTNYRPLGWFQTNSNSPVNIGGAILSTSGDGSALESGMVKIAEITVTGSSVASIDFTSIPLIYNDLMLTLHVRPVTNNARIHMRFNGDTGNNYDWESWADSRNVSNGVSLMDLTSARGQSNTANKAMSSTVWITDYANTSLYQNSHWISGIEQTTSHYGVPGTGQWANVAAINQVTFSASSGNIDVGSTITLYGLGG